MSTWSSYSFLCKGFPIDFSAASFDLYNVTFRPVSVCRSYFSHSDFETSIWTVVRYQATLTILLYKYGERERGRVRCIKSIGPIGVCWLQTTYSSIIERSCYRQQDLQMRSAEAFNWNTSTRINQCSSFAAIVTDVTIERNLKQSLLKSVELAWFRPFYLYAALLTIFSHQSEFSKPQ